MLAASEFSTGAHTSNNIAFNDSHFHLTNYIQEGTNIRDFLKIMGATTERMLKDPAFGNLYFDISWDEVAKYLSGPDAIAVAADLINRYPDRFLFGTDSVAPHDRDEYLKTYRAYEELWPQLTSEASHKVRIGNQHLLGYFSTNKALDGSWRNVTVNLKAKNAAQMTVKTRPGYYAPRMDSAGEIQRRDQR
jgi:hypothetical protein